MIHESLSIETEWNEYKDKKKVKNMEWSEWTLCGPWSGLLVAVWFLELHHTWGHNPSSLEPGLLGWGAGWFVSSFICFAAHILTLVDEFEDVLFTFLPFNTTWDSATIMLPAIEFATSMKASLKSVSMLVWVLALVPAEGVGGGVSCSTGVCKYYHLSPVDWSKWSDVWWEQKGGPELASDQGLQQLSLSREKGSGIAWTLQSDLYVSSWPAQATGACSWVAQRQDTWWSCVSSKMSKLFSSGQCKYIQRTTRLKIIWPIWMIVNLSTNLEAGISRPCHIPPCLPQYHMNCPSSP